MEKDRHLGRNWKQQVRPTAFVPRNDCTRRWKRAAESIQSHADHHDCCSPKRLERSWNMTSSCVLNRCQILPMMITTRWVVEEEKKERSFHALLSKRRQQPTTILHWGTLLLAPGNGKMQIFFHLNGLNEPGRGTRLLIIESRGSSSSLCHAEGWKEEEEKSQQQVR